MTATVGLQALTFSAGLAATSAILQLLSVGDHVVAMNDLYGGISLFQLEFEVVPVLSCSCDRLVTRDEPHVSPYWSQDGAEV